MRIRATPTTTIAAAAIRAQWKPSRRMKAAIIDANKTLVSRKVATIGIGATVIALFPLASHGGPLWEPMCYAQIGGLSFATFVTLLLVPVLYEVFRPGVPPKEQPGPSPAGDSVPGSAPI